MTDSVASRPPATAPIPQARNTFVPAYDGEPDTEDISFRDLWDDPDKGMTFADFLDIINPLQHIPVISTLYRLVTGDTISQGARMAGDVLFGGVPGLLASGIVLAFEEASGDTAEGHIMAMLDDDAPDAEAGQRQQAAAAAPAAPAAAKTAPVAATAVPVAAKTVPVAATTVAVAAKTASTARPAPPAPAGHAAATPLFTARRPAAGGFAPAVQPAKTAPAAAAAPETADKARVSRADRMAAERQRIAETIARARNQQIGLLMANLLPSAAESRNSRDDEDSSRSGARKPAPVAAPIAARPGDPFLSHPFMLPPGASPEMVSRAMERALSKYQQGLRARGATR